MLQSRAAEIGLGFRHEGSKPPPSDGFTMGSMASKAPPQIGQEQGLAIARQEGIPRASIPMKRSREERDRSHDPSSPTSSLGPPQRPRTPPNLRQAFVPERVDHWSPTVGHRPHDSWVRSPDANRARDRIDHWSPPQKQSPPRRPNGSRQSSFGLEGQARSPPFLSPVDRANRAPGRTSSDSHDASRFSNLTWTAPHLHKSKVNGTNAPEPQDPGGVGDPASSGKAAGSELRESDFDKVNFNGLRGVPTGPKKPGVVTRDLPPNLAIRRAPHIFISSQHLPALPSIAKHLFGALRHHVSKESDIQFDDSGWYLRFEDSAAGRETLQACFRKRHQVKLFSQYSLEMEVYPHGNPTASYGVNGSPEKSSFHAGDDAEPKALVTEADLVEQTSKDSRVLPGTHITSDENRISEHQENNLPSAHQTLKAIGEPPPLTAVNIRRMRNSTPLRVPSRPDRDDTSSCISGLTGSDISQSKRLQCHVCQSSTPLETESLVSCSSCPRRYHRRCHAQPSIPADLDQNHSWQCRRCIKKKIQPRSNLALSSPIGAADPKPLSSHSEERPSKRPRLDALEHERPHMPSAIDHANDHVHKNDDLRLKNLKKAPQSGVSASNESNSRESNATQIHSDESRFLEANDLVAKSFSAAEADTPESSATGLKSGKLGLLRKKSARLEPAIKNIEFYAYMSYEQIEELERDREEALEDIGQIFQETREEKNLSAAAQGRGFGYDSLGEEIAQTGSESRAPDSRKLIHLNADNLRERKNANPSGELGFSGEVPESPEELIKSIDQAAPPHANSSYKLDLSEQAPFRPMGSNKMQKMKPGAPAVDHCSKCGKKIAYNPSGSNRLCSKCKAAEPPAELKTNSIAQPAVEKEAIANEFDGDERRDMNHSVDKMLSTETAAVVEADPNSKLSRTATAEAETSKKNVRKSCDECRSRHRRCAHLAAAPSPQPTSVAQKESDESGKKQASNDQPKGDLDFWTTKAAPTNGKNGITGKTNGAPDQDMGAREEEESEISDGETASSTSQGDEEAPTKGIPKRKSQTRPAKNEYDLGDSFARPKGVYEKLIGMALCSAPDHRLKGTDVTQWVADNIPGYKIGEGLWEGSLRATLTLKKQGYEHGSGKEGLWKKVEIGLRKNETCYWELLPGQAEKMLHWDPVLQQPVSPPKLRRKGHLLSTRKEAKGKVTEDVTARKELGKPKLKRLRQGRTQSLVKDQNGPIVTQSSGATEQAVARTEAILSSSDEEPLVNRKRTTSKRPRPAEKATMAAATAERAVSDPMEIDGDGPAAVASNDRDPAFSAKQQQARGEQSTVQPPTIEDMIHVSAKNTNYSAKSLFAEWPEYDPKNAFDRDAKIAEIKARPTRKQKFGKQSWLAEMGSPEWTIDYQPTGPQERSRRANRGTVYPWEAVEENVVQCSTLEELFNLPKNPIAIMHEGQLAYRDGTRNEDGTLPRAKVIYKSGHV